MVLRIEEATDGSWAVYSQDRTRDAWTDLETIRAEKDEAIQAAREVTGVEIPLQPCELPGRLKLAADILEDCGRLMEYRGGFGPWAAKGREAIGAAEMAREWAGEMEA